MSRTTSVEFRGQDFWAYDVSLSILLAELIGVAEGLGPEQCPEWLAEVLPQLRVHAVVSDFLFDLDFGLADAQLDEFVALLEEACRRLRQRRTVTAAEAAEWQVLDQ